MDHSGDEQAPVKGEEEAADLHRSRINDQMFTTDTNVTNRMSLTYHKLRQMWVSQMITRLNSIMERMKEEENGEPDFWND